MITCAPLNFEVGESYAQPDLGRTRLVDRPGWWLAAGRVGQAESLSQLGAEPLVAGTANSTSVIGVELLAALEQGGIMVQLGAAVGAGWLRTPDVSRQNAGTEATVAASTLTLGHTHTCCCNRRRPGSAFRGGVDSGPAVGSDTLPLKALVVYTQFGPRT
jgi:hypothetical protein